MDKLKTILLLTFLFQLSLTIKQSEAGKNDWSFENIGEIQSLNFINNPPYFRHATFFKNNDLALYGYLTQAGILEHRNRIQKNQKIIQENARSMILVNSHKQIIKFDKLTNTRKIDNRLLNNNQIDSQVNAVVQLNSGKILYSSKKVILQFSSKSQYTKIIVPQNFVNLKIFGLADNVTVYSLTYSEQKKTICINQISSFQKILLQKQCKSLSNTQRIAQIKFQKLSQSHFYFNFNNLQNFIINTQNNNIEEFAKKQHFIQNFQSQKTLKMSDNQFYTYTNTVQRMQSNIIYAEHNNMNKNLKIYLEQTSSNTLTIYQSTQQSMLKNKIAVIEADISNIKREIKRIWVNYNRKASKKEIQIIIQYAKDLRIVCEVVSETTLEVRQQWEREESLAYIDRVLFMKHEGFSDHLNNQYHMATDSYLLEGKKISDVLSYLPNLLYLRIETQINDLCLFFQKILHKFLNFSINDFSQSSLDSQQESKYGLQKNIIIFTKKNTILMLDTKTSTIKWKKTKTQKMLSSSYNLISLLKLKQQYEKQIAICIHHSLKEQKIIIEQISQNGELTTLKEFHNINDQKPSVFKISPHSLQIVSEKKVYRFDINEKLGSQENRNYYFYSIEEEEEKDSRVIGWRSVGEDVVRTWEFFIPSSQKLIKSQTVYKGQEEANLPIVNDKRVLFKNVDFANIAFLTLEEKEQQAGSLQKYHRLHLYLINGETGTLQFHEFQSYLNPNLHISLAYDEHNALVSYYSTRNRVYEIWSVEAFQLPEESQLLTKPYKPYHQRQDIAFRQNVYGITVPIKHIFITESKQALLRRNLLIVTNDDRLYSIQREYLSTRRPKSSDPQSLNIGNDMEIDFIKTKYPPEEYLLPVNQQNFITYKLTPLGLNNIRFGSTDFQSTIFMFLYGVDCFLIRIAPEKSFDMLPSNFDKLMRLAALIGIAVFALAFRMYVKEAKLQKPHLQ